ncbi:hypothetical protein NHQ30_008948 [Ciborinia camelliae]|nr:hypothetical protein NHQ30_008948 [Ciborinia camelliae]
MVPVSSSRSIFTLAHEPHYELDDIIYERFSKLGGVWAYDERKPPESKYPSILPPGAGLYSDVDSDFEDYTPRSLSIRTDRLELTYAPPGPAYFGLTANISTKLQEMKGHLWKEDTGDFVNVKVFGGYLADYARKFHLEQVLKYNTKVEAIYKANRKWIVKSTLPNKTHDGEMELIENEEVVCI